jgi:hypothetical protein
VRQVVDGLTEVSLDRRTEPVEGPGWPSPRSYPVRECLLVILNEEWEHRRFAERDLDALETPTAWRGRRPHPQGSAVVSGHHHVSPVLPCEAPWRYVRFCRHLTGWQQPTRAPQNGRPDRQGVHDGARELTMVVTNGERSPCTRHG